MKSVEEEVKAGVLHFSCLPQKNSGLFLRYVITNDVSHVITL